ncbi:MAG: prephenate dehydratase [Bacteroidetes bacterium]|nr:MAG: prephenate dehydratase [Bacteroidota bacterium]
MTSISATATSPASSLHTRRVAIQGYAGAFHELAARRFFTDKPLTVVPAHTFQDVVEAVESGETADAGLMAIENTLAGSLMANYQLLLDSNLMITGEVFLRIEQNLLSLPGVTMADLREVHSHPVAIAQCRPFFRNYPHIQLVETVDTALSARQVREQGWSHVGAIASDLAADLYGLQFLARGIETNKQNHTRFLVLEQRHWDKIRPDANKISVSFAVDHTVGSLYKVLAVLAAYNVNLSKIQSAPIIGHPWEYRFFVDFEVHGDLSWSQAVEAIRPITRDLKVLGAYRAGEKDQSLPSR